MSTLPTYRWRLAPAGLATKRQLRAQDLRPGGQDIVAQLERPRRRRPPLIAHLYRLDLAKPVRPMTPARWRSIEAMNRARRVCPDCKREQDYTIPTSRGCCNNCWEANNVW